MPSTDLTPSFSNPQTLPVVQGLSPSQVALPQGAWLSVYAFLCERFPKVSPTVWQERIEGQKVFLQNLLGEYHVVKLDMPYQAHCKVFYYRSVENEMPIPFTETILYQDDLIVVVDKPHFLPVNPVGRYVQETLQTRLRKKLQLPDLQAIHRIDRETAGLVVLAKAPQHRNAYQTLFRQRQVKKNYHAIAPNRENLTFPLLYESHLQTATNFMQMEEIPLNDHVLSNAQTWIEKKAHTATLALYCLSPITGLRHQLRAQMAALQIPILNDTIYPVLQKELDVPDYAKPLQLLAKSIKFTDPITGEERFFESQLSLSNISTFL